MNDVINLKRFKKSKKRTDKEQSATENRIKHGRTRAEKKTEKSLKDLEKRKLDGHKRDDKDE